MQVIPTLNPSPLHGEGRQQAILLPSLVVERGLGDEVLRSRFTRMPYKRIRTPYCSAESRLPKTPITRLLTDPTRFLNIQAVQPIVMNGEKGHFAGGGFAEGGVRNQIAVKIGF